MHILKRMKAIGPVSYLVVGIVAAILGLLPWLLAGLRLPLQNLWAITVSPENMPIVLLPFSQYALPLIVAMMVTGSAFAGVFARKTLAHQPRFALAAIVAGVLIVQLAATAQTVVTVSNGLTQSRTAFIYLAGITAGTMMANLVGIAVLLIIARAPAAGVVVAVSVAAVAVSVWLPTIFLYAFDLATNESIALVRVVTRWVPPVIVGLAVVWSGLGTISRVVAAIMSLLTLWVGPALFTGVSAALGSRALADDPAAMVDFGERAFLGALGTGGESLPLIIPAIAVMVLGQVMLRMTRRRRHSTASTV